MRAAQKSFSNAATTAGATGGLELGEGQAVQSNLTPFLTGELTAQHSMTPEMQNQLLTEAAAGTGGATGALESKAELTANRTGTGVGATAALEEMQRERGRQLAKTNEGVAAEDVKGALENRQEAAKGLAQLGEADTSAALEAMGLQSKDLAGEVEAGQSGWFQNMTGLISSLRGKRE